MALIYHLCSGVASITLRSSICGASNITACSANLCLQQVRSYNMRRIFMPRPGQAKNYRFKVHYPEDGEYTVKPLKMTKLAGRDPDTGRIINGCLGGGAKRNYRWVDLIRTGPTDGTFLEERVMKICYDPNRPARLALVGSGDNLRYLIATDSMKEGDLIRTSSHVPRIPVRPKEGDAYPLGAVPLGTSVCCVELLPGQGIRIVKAAGTKAIVRRKVGDKIVIKLPSKKEMALDEKCMATVGRVSNVDHNKKHIGSAQRNRWLGNRPRSGLWQRKDGYRGRKIRPLPPVNVYAPKKDPIPEIVFTCSGQGPTRPIIQSTLRVT